MAKSSWPQLAHQGTWGVPLTSPGNVRMMSRRMSRLRGRRAHRRMSPARQEEMLCWFEDLQPAEGAVHGRQGGTAELLQ